MEPVLELTPAQILDQPWVKRAGRLAAFLAVALGAASVSYFFSLGNRVEAIEAARAQRIVVTDANTTHLNAEVADLQNDMHTIKSDLVAVKVSVGEVKGILQQMQVDTNGKGGDLIAFSPLLQPK